MLLPPFPTIYNRVNLVNLVEEVQMKRKLMRTILPEMLQLEPCKNLVIERLR
jgi:hypothetical protein